jgi:hypothetical protein
MRRWTAAALALVEPLSGRFAGGAAVAGQHRSPCAWATWAALVAIEALGNHGIAYAITQASFRLQVDRMLVYGLSVVVLYGMIDACLVLIGKAIILRWAPREGRLLATLGQS